MRRTGSARPSRDVSPRRFLQVSTASLAVLFLVVTSGAFVRLTGSGLGCENWPRCGDRPYPEQGFHAFVEFGNRLVALVGIVLTLATWLGARRVPGLPPFARLAALGACAGAIAQIPLGGLTVILELHPLAVMSHFLLALAVVGCALVAVVEGWSLARGLGQPVGPRRLRLAVTWVGLPAAAALVLTGAVATASGPHSGSEEAVQRLGWTVADAVYWHVRVAAVFGIGVLALGRLLYRLRRVAPGLLRLWLLLLIPLVAQAVLGEVQYRQALPWGLVLLHVFLAAAIWTLSLALAYALWRPPLALVAPAARAAGAARPAGAEPTSA